jgi:hypothetical protein
MDEAAEGASLDTRSRGGGGVKLIAPCALAVDDASPTADEDCDGDEMGAGRGGMRAGLGVERFCTDHTRTVDLSA